MRLFITLLLLTVLPCLASPRVELKGLAQWHWVEADASEPWLKSWMRRGTGQSRYDDTHGLELGQAIVATKLDLGSGLSLKGVLNGVADQNHSINFSQLYGQYTPLISPNYQLRVRAGLFYPEMAFENVDTGWLSPYGTSFSAVNSWMAEEQRTVGVEARVSFGGRRARSPHSFSLTGALFKANDTLGTLLAWRGFAVHDRQSVLNETLGFARYPSLGPGMPLEKQAAWVEPYREIDHRIGSYWGAEWDYRGQSKLRYFYYDNNGDPLVLGRGGQYAWDTRYHSLAWQYRFNGQWRWVAQGISGNTLMGADIVDVDFSAIYTTLAYKQDDHLTSLRLERFITKDLDATPYDDNNGDGRAFTAYYRYQLSPQWQLGLEYLWMDTYQANRQQWYNWSPNVTQRQWTASVTWRF
ncbi:hypothetical protein HMF8227_00684 [Saliniradius amylolyticus]|uniref:Porin domain-containing protein n=1 Tax=Saliniradius amylolyticus TaxID=2183582 RepID=A0A2S2E1P0_9ALTE|nr:hypothetical protein [Saliniradius amylolyticus]AWL11180.1 hypothetical protein HMF8227_00684 [Saliniradius amylolyticus]